LPASSATPLAENRGGVMPGRSAAIITPTPSASGWPAADQAGLRLRQDRRDRLGPVENPVHINDFHATIMNLFGFDHKRLSVKYKGLNVRSPIRAEGDSGSVI
jgi:hypothetical protein